MLFFRSVIANFVRGLALLALGGGVLSEARGQEEPIEIKTVAGLRFDPPRFQVKAGAMVRLHVENTDDMAHNFIIVAPGARQEIVNAAMAMPITPEQTFLPPSDKVLFHTPVLAPGKSVFVEFTAPAEGVYPYVCTYPGHGLIMYGAMYVGRQELPAIAADEHLPEMIRDQAKNPTLHAYAAEAPMWYRTFMRDSGPASIAVALPGGQNYCWDAGECRLRYAWRGAFLDPLPHWRGNGDAWAEVKGAIYYRADAGFPLRFGDVRKVPEVKFLGYRVVEKLPEFHYLAGGVDVWERIKPAHHGGIEATFTVTGAKAPVYFVGDTGAGVEFASDAGRFIDGVLKPSAEKAKSFTVTFTEIIGREAVGYWSMDDVLDKKKPLAVDGVKGRALVFDGTKSQFATGVKASALAQGATFSVWAKLATPEQPEQAYIGARSLDGVFALGANLDGQSGFGVLVKNGSEKARILAVIPEKADDGWHQLAATLDAKELRFYLDGRPAGKGMAAALPVDAEFFLGSCGQMQHAGGLLDEARIYSRVLTEKEIAELHEDEKPRATRPVILSGAVKVPTTVTASAASAPKAVSTGTTKATTTPKPTTAATPKPAAKPEGTTKIKPAAKGAKK